MSSNKQQIKAYIRLNYGDSLNDILKQTVKMANGISYDNIYLEYDYDDRYVHFSYEREETDKEFEDRISLEKRREELDRNRDISHLKYLLSVYGIPE